jgi:PAS domain-containing protein
MIHGFALYKIVLDKSSKPIDFEFLEINSSFEKMTGLKQKEVIGKKITSTVIILIPPSPMTSI